MGGVAAKAQCTRKNEQVGMVRSGPRLRRGNTFPKQIEIPSKVPEEAEAKSAPAVSAWACDALSPSTTPTLPEFTQPFEFDTDSETAVGTETSTTGTGATNDLEPDVGSDVVKSPSIREHRTDFSNYLGISLGAETCADSDSFTRVNSMEDAYGWEAELDRKMKCEVASAQAYCPYQCSRRALVSKHSLLHRVFSLHSSRRINSRS